MAKKEINAIDVTVYSPSELAKELGVGATTLRRWSETLEVDDSLKFRSTTKGKRSYSADDLSRFTQAKELANGRNNITIEDALKQSFKPDPVDQVAELKEQWSNGSPLEMADLTNVMSGLVEQNKDLNAKLDQVLSELSELKESQNKKGLFSRLFNRSK